MNSLATLQDKILDQHVPLADVLRQAKVVAAALRNPELAKWIDQELNGYGAPYDNLPTYRRFPALSVGVLIGYGRQLTNAPLNTSGLDEPIRSWAQDMLITEDIGTLEYTTRDGRTNDLQQAWPPEYIAACSSRFFEGLNCITAHKVVSVGCIRHVLEVVRNKLLGFVLELRDKYPQASETDKSLSSVPIDGSGAVFNTFIVGNGNTTSMGQQSTAISVDSVKMDDLDSLAAFMKALGIPAASTDELIQSVEEDNIPKDATTVGTKVGTWIKRAAKQLGAGALNLAEAATTDILVKAISAYYGWH
jgi:hypothetical protein